VTRNFNVDAMVMLGYGVHSKQLPEHRTGSIRRELEPAYADCCRVTGNTEATK